MWSQISIGFIQFFSQWKEIQIKRLNVENILRSTFFGITNIKQICIQNWHFMESITWEPYGLAVYTYRIAYRLYRSYQMKIRRTVFFIGSQRKSIHWSPSNPQNLFENPHGKVGIFKQIPLKTKWHHTLYVILQFIDRF